MATSTYIRPEDIGNTLEIIADKLDVATDLFGQFCATGTLAISNQNVNDNGAITTTIDALDNGWTSPAPGQLEYAGTPNKVSLSAHVKFAIAQNANIQRPAPVLELYRDTTLLTAAATGYIRDASDHEEDSNTIVWTDRNPGTDPVYRILSRREATAGVVTSQSGQFNAEACTQGVLGPNTVPQGYQDFGSMRVQWGRVDSSSQTGITIVPLNAPFADTNFIPMAVVQSFIPNNRNIEMVGPNGHTTTQFQARTNPGTTAGFNWIAIGFKP